MRTWLLAMLIVSPLLSACEPRSKPWSSAERTTLSSLNSEVEQWMRRT